ncbi:uncharacterized protein DDB_G0284459 [Impatiens glandulifera]|uniref:uncharacterized protein DDB_G0284459 n=1 Tax=Impatiens glandulifera TaxID=253017 RepID=UPI001FB0EF9A|nr:uncharacterized protein DDB_G0284459 [Impatiens glandulifera]
MAEKHRFSAPSTRNEDNEVKREDDEEIYENIEAPKFVDFTKPEQHLNRIDDRYWFCLRVGCDQKHEEELDHETISKNFVLRVMAARSPNVRLNKIMNRKTSSRPLKCPLSVPAKPSKSRLSRLALISSFSKKKKLVENPKEKLQQQPSNPNLNSTPKLQKVRTVAAKYLTTPRNRKSLLPKHNTFHSVQNNMKSSRISVPKSGRMIAKALSFNSPKKGITLKSSAELKTPLSKICKGMKKLRLEQQSVPAKQGTSIKDRSKVKKVVCNEKNVKTKSKEVESSKKKPLIRSNEVDGELPEKEGTVIIQETAVPSVGNYDTEEDKENALISENSNSDNGAQTQTQMQTIERENLVVGSKNETSSSSKQHTCQAKEQISKDGGLKKYKKLTVTNPKPFRLRTDERGILKEAVLERKILTPVPQTAEEAATVSTKCENGRRTAADSVVVSQAKKKSSSPPSPLKLIAKPIGISTTTTTTKRPDIKKLLTPVKEKDKPRKTLKEAASSAKSTSKGKRPIAVVGPKEESNQKTICKQKDRRTVIRI